MVYRLVYGVQASVWCTGWCMVYRLVYHVKKLWTSMHNSAYNCDFKNLIAPLNSLGTLEIYHVIKTE